MKIIESPLEAHEQVAQWRQARQTIGLVPTMGALHAGHLALVRRSRDECQRTIATIFVNPTQFAPNEDFSRYPRTIDDDLRGLRELKTDMVFLPKLDQLYPSGFSTYVQPPKVALPLEGVFRPEHFRGVATIVLKLFNILPTSISYFGQKDYQQLAVIRHMVADLNLPICIQGCETVREPDGLAMSSRNRYLSPEQRHTALSLWRALTEIRQQVAHGCRDIGDLEQVLQRVLSDGGVEQIDYARIVDRDSLDSLQQLDRPAIALIAAHFGTTRLIDNALLEIDEKP